MKLWKVILLAAVLFLFALVALAGLVLSRFFREDPASSWTYQSPEYGFRIDLPSSDWKQVQRPNAAAAFSNRKHSILVEVQAHRGDESSFDKDVNSTKDYFQRSRGELLTEPRLKEGTNDAGNPYAFWTVQARADNGGAVYIARSLVWCKDQSLVVSVMMEGPLTMRSKAGKASEQQLHENAARVICLSVR
jgi:hypothetical protein